MPVEHCRNGHELTLQNTQLRFSTKGNYQYRRCRICFDLTDSDVADIEKHFFEGGTMRSLVLTAPKMITFKERSITSPAWWNRMTALSTHNGNVRKATAARALRAQQTHCKQGHPLSGDNLRLERDSKTAAPRRACRACRNASFERGNYKYTAEQIETATDCIMNKGMTISEVTQRRGDRSRFIKYEALAIALSKDPTLNERLRHQSTLNADAKLRAWKGTWKSKSAGYMPASEVAAVIVAHPDWTAKRVAEETGRDLTYIWGVANRKGLKTATMRVARPKPIVRPKLPRIDRGPTLTGIIAAQPHEVYTTIDQIVPRGLDYDRRKEIVSEMILAVLEGELNLADAKAAYPRFLTASYRQFSYKAFGDIRSPVPLDAPAYLDGTMLRVETVSESLWDRM
ncbi:hypothetical protein H8A99_13380 [Bradyrhizobium sp. Arg68]|uniref:hypothetical protein n=1 Tax=Bradyrhizobium ivorense TaxID=2511166 RepID=UPI001E5FC0D9|nr:hypothetical protein [Bradyrhizobium ivorense]MCC8937437.1 hypothetical protein [Bradyrhizobium ivorense]